MSQPIKKLKTKTKKTFETKSHCYNKKTSAVKCNTEN